MDSRKIKQLMLAARDIAAEAALETLWPTRCAVCDAPGKLLCETCAAHLPFIDACRACPRCGAPFGVVQCSECNPVMLAASNRHDLPFDGLASALVLTDGVRNLVTAYKDRNERRLSAIIANIMARYISPDWISGAEGDVALTFVPATAQAVRRRGFDHAEEIAQNVAQAANLPCVCLFARPKSSDQRKLSRAERQKNMARRLQLLPEANVAGTVIVTDDVCTTGATLYAAADALRQNGASRLYGLTFARAWG